MRALLAASRRLLLKAQYRAGRANDRLRRRIAAAHPTVSLDQVHRRLELLLTAVYGRPIPIAAIENDYWTRERVRQLASRDPRAREQTPGMDGETIYLPSELAAGSGDAEAIARYRLFAIEQAERIARGTAARAAVAGPLERDLYLLREAAAIDAHIVRSHPGIAAALGEERRAALARRPKLDGMTHSERHVEFLLRETLSQHPGDVESPSSDPSASLSWARTEAARIHDGHAGYRGLPPSAIWGTIRSGTTQLPAPLDIAHHSLSSGNTESQHAQSRKGEPSPGTPGSSNDIRELASKSDDDAGDTSGVADATVAGDNADAEIFKNLPPAIYYDEWSADAGVYVKRGAAVRVHEPVDGDDAWARETLQRHAALVRRIRHQFERLRARRSLLSRQRAGDELDIDAIVDAIVDRRVGHAPDDRLYVESRSARRGLAIALLADVSASTGQPVSSDLRIIDLEKIAVLLAAEALDALGDLYAVFAFAGKTATNVKVTSIKEFSERSGEAVRRRVAALEPGGFTRLGAAIRHATQCLALPCAGHRMLLLLSDGRPNDADVYQGDYGVEDSRQAIFEARASGIYPFCLTIDNNASEYLPRIFGRAGHTVLQRPQQLPTALLNVVETLIRRR